ncbi:glycerophosphoinositol inositolphosphodiesterase GDPD2 isoform X2 [Ornithorhynchus anatinus]|uniref:glycerophosphoinositol inositolphosphodiesterase GDPD2 isoform X2 n=1 Tax=Ornithorhynchus anatinus TaxID=9258 RepID=UPI0010A760AA|nr:glycerophosphoinositol inositolphosphodiesterase GDPD2 isoform X2 [Ornithorhynchus anatinus]
MAEASAWRSGCARGLFSLYSCRWRGHGTLETSQCDRVWLGLLSATCLLAVGWLYVSLVLLNDLHNFNEFLFRNWGHWLDWSWVLMLVASLLVVYSSVLLGLLLLTVVVVGAGLLLLGVQWREEWDSLRLSLQATAPFLHIGCAAALTLLAWPVADAYYGTPRTGCRGLLIPFLGSALAVYLLPLAISSPCIMDPALLPPKPTLVGHRGAPMLAPENTLMSLRKTANCGASVFETDVMVSSDGVPFLMHDERLVRTTNVAPEWANEHSSNLSWKDLRTLNAGSWFLRRRPFWGSPALSEGERLEAENQSVPALDQALRVAADLRLAVMFDLRRPPAHHAHRHDFVQKTLGAVLDAGVPQDMVLWLPDEERAEVRRRAPGLQHVYGRHGTPGALPGTLRGTPNGTRGPPPRRLNLPYQDLPRLDLPALHRDNVSVNLFVVDAPWLFSLLWCSAVDSVTTNACHRLRQLRHPLWLISPRTYQLVWVVTDCVSALLLLWTFSVQRRRARKRERCGPESTVLLTRIDSFVSSATSSSPGPPPAPAETPRPPNGP